MTVLQAMSPFESPHGLGGGHKVVDTRNLVETVSSACGCEQTEPLHTGRGLVEDLVVPGTARTLRPSGERVHSRKDGADLLGPGSGKWRVGRSGVGGQRGTGDSRRQGLDKA